MGNSNVTMSRDVVELERDCDITCQVGVTAKRTEKLSTYLKIIRAWKWLRHACLEIDFHRWTLNRLRRRKNGPFDTLANVCR